MLFSNGALTASKNHESIWLSYLSERNIRIVSALIESFSPPSPLPILELLPQRCKPAWTQATQVGRGKRPGEIAVSDGTLASTIQGFLISEIRLRIRYLQAGAPSKPINPVATLAAERPAAILA
jgi:hypothetical protein